MALSEKQLQWIDQGIRLAVAAVLAAVQAAGEQGEIDWNSVRITETPEMALERARLSRAQPKDRAEDAE